MFFPSPGLSTNILMFSLSAASVTECGVNFKLEITEMQEVKESLLTSEEPRRRNLVQGV